MLTNRFFILILILLGLLPISRAQESAAVVPPVEKAVEISTPLSDRISYPELSREEKTAVVLIVRLLEEQHFARHELDRSTGTEWIKVFAENLDPNHLYFLKEDMDQFHKLYAQRMIEMIRMGDITPAFHMFGTFKQRLESRMKWVKERFSQPFDFKEEEFYQPDRSKLGWPEGDSQADELWDKKIKFECLQGVLNDEKIGKITEDLQKRYDRIFEIFKEFDKENILQTYLTSLASIYDPHSAYLSPSTLEDFAIEMKLSLFGIGAELTTEDGYCVIRRIIPGGPADLDDTLRPNDKIEAVAQDEAEFESVVDMKLRNAVKLIRGPKDSVVRLRVIPAKAKDPSERIIVTLVRDKIHLRNQQASAKLIEKPGIDGKKQRLGVIKLPMFYGDSGGSSDAPSSSTTDDVATLVKSLKKKDIDGLILDLRGNTGGLLDEAVRLTGLFIDKGPVVQVKYHNGRISVLEDQDAGILYGGPLVVLTNRFSASASEIFAGALQNYNRAVIVGDKSTHGKGTVQAVIELGRFLPTKEGAEPNAGALKLTIQQFYLPNGDSTQRRGVIPDIVIPSPNDFVEDLGEANRAHALPWNRINPAGSFQPLSIENTRKIVKLRDQFFNRLTSKPEYKFYLDEVERFKQKFSEKKISLNEKSRRVEREKQKDREKEKEDLIPDEHPLDSKILYFTFNEKGKDINITQEPPEVGGKYVPRSKDEKKDEEEKKNSFTFYDDIHLLETLNIMSDLIILGSEKKQEAMVTQARF